MKFALLDRRWIHILAAVDIGICERATFFSLLHCSRTRLSRKQVVEEHVSVMHVGITITGKPL
jgi:hypothetical protein